MESLESGILEGVGKGETACNYCRLKSLEGSGREVLSGIPGEKTWDGTWAVKKEMISVPWGSATVHVPTNYWDGWVSAQRERDFTLDLSRFHIVLGIQLRL